MDYGTFIAMQKAKKNREKKSQEDQSSKPVKARKAKRPPTMILDPLNQKNVRLPDFKYDWNDETTAKNSEYLASEFARGQKAKVLVLPPGVGKTAIALKTIGNLQLQRKRKVPFVVIASRSIIDGRGWHNTILAWNTDNPTNKLEPFMIDTFDRFSSMLEFTETLQKICIVLSDDGIIIIDEVQNFKNPTSKRSKKLQKLSMFKKLGLSATPLTNDVVMDTSSYLIMNGDFPNKTQFMVRTELDQKVGRFGELLIRDKSGLISEHLWPFYPEFLRLSANVIYRPNVDLTVLEMPDVKTTVHNLPFNERLHEDMRSLAKAYQSRMFDSSTDYRMAMIERVCGDEDRLDKLIDLITDEEVKQPLIFYTHNSVKDALIKRLDDEGIEFQIISGGNSFAEVDLSKDLPILVQYQSGSEGIEMKNSNTSIFYENQTSYRILEQSRGRNRRRGMAAKIRHHHLISPVIYDTQLFSRVIQREELSNRVLDEIAEKSLEILKGD